ncbi:transporter substrate-binding domain-containing protein [uncultured Pseudodesulfovibrio sp.]|uniref:substrate-binding periplasmic protein n=1 Tax=uncultured Pseudodesulfovibrio sp. TaxID=2035858 RepID=UPI0029C8DECA|nr:transporter substrate-binding domain-containing protein [uncultured Pseudodesulfovibrio sp.]
MFAKIHRWSLVAIALLVLLWTSSARVVLADDVVTFALFTRGWLPFEMVVKGQARGAAVDIFRVSMPEGVATRVLMLPASRSALRTPGDGVYTRLECQDWMGNAGLYLWSDPVMRLRTVLVSRRSGPIEYKDESSLYGLTIGCIKSYSYPDVAPLFNSGKAYRYDVNSDVVLLRMLKAGRVDVALFDEYTVHWVVHNSREMSDDDFYIAEQELGSSDLRFVFNRHPGWEARLPEVNARIKANREAGVYDRIMDRY